MHRILDLITSPSYSRTTTLLVIVIIALSIPLTVFVAQKQQEIRQQAAEIDPGTGGSVCIPKVSIACSVCNPDTLTQRCKTDCDTGPYAYQDLPCTVPAITAGNCSDFSNASCKNACGTDETPVGGASCSVGICCQKATTSTPATPPAPAASPPSSVPTSAPAVGGLPICDTTVVPINQIPCQAQPNTCNGRGTQILSFTKHRTGGECNPHIENVACNNAPPNCNIGDTCSNGTCVPLCDTAVNPNPPCQAQPNTCSGQGTQVLEFTRDRSGQSCNRHTETVRCSNAPNNCSASTPSCIDGVCRVASQPTGATTPPATTPPATTPPATTPPATTPPSPAPGATAAPTAQASTQGVSCSEELVRCAFDCSAERLPNGNWQCYNNRSRATCTTTCTSAPIATPTPPPGPSTQLAFTVGLDGIGTVGDSKNPNVSRVNTPTKRTSRTFFVKVIDSELNQQASVQGTISYDSGLGKYKGTVNLGKVVPNGTYIIKVRAQGYKTRVIRNVIITGQSIDIQQQVNLPTGDINSNDEINLVDYEILRGCLFKDASGSCEAADLDDNGKVDEIDYNLFLRDFAAGQREE